MMLTEKNVVVVGGCGGIGSAICRQLLQRKIANLAILDYVDCCGFLDDLQREHPTTSISIHKMNICDKKNIEEIYNEISARIKFIDILVNCAGVMADANPELTISVNLLGTINSTLTMFNLMDKSQGGRGGLIVNVSSVLGLEPMASMPVYTASKHGVVGFTRSLGEDFYFNKTGITMIAICPGFTDTNMIRNIGLKGSFTFPYCHDYEMKVSPPLQSADECARSIVEAIQLNKNGSVWLCEEGKLEEVHMKKYRDYA